MLFMSLKVFFVSFPSGMWNKCQHFEVSTNGLHMNLVAATKSKWREDSFEAIGLLSINLFY